MHSFLIWNHNKYYLWNDQVYILKTVIFLLNTYCGCEASRGAVAQRVTVKPTGYRFDPYSRRWNIYLKLYFHFFALVPRLSAVLSSATQHAMPPEFSRKWGTKCLKTKFPLPTLQCEADFFIVIYCGCNYMFVIEHEYFLYCWYFILKSISHIMHIDVV